MSHTAKKNRQAARPQRNLWPWVLAAGGLVLLAVALVGLSQTSASPKVPLEVQGAPKLKIDRQKADLGDVHLGQTVSVTFNLANVGDQPLRFTEAPYVELVEGC